MDFAVCDRSKDLCDVKFSQIEGNGRAKQSRQQVNLLTVHLWASWLRGPTDSSFVEELGIMIAHLLQFIIVEKCLSLSPPW